MSGTMVQHLLESVNRHIKLGLNIVIVFDGALWPLKAACREKRVAKADELHKKAQAALDAGDLDGAAKVVRQAARPTDQLMSCVIFELLRLKIPFRVAPFEADAHIAYLLPGG